MLVLVLVMYLDGTYYRPERDDGGDTDGGHGVLVLNFVPLPRNNAHGNAHCAANHGSSNSTHKEIN